MMGGVDSLRPLGDSMHTFTKKGTETMPYPLIETRVAGIPCQIHVVSFYYDDSDFDFVWELYDRKGYRARWLEQRYMDQDDAARRRDVERMEQDLRGYYAEE